MDYVKVNKERVFINDGNLYLESFNIHKISDIKRLKHYPNLKALYLEKNKISRIEQLDKLINLKKLHLEFNLITEINGLDSLICSDSAAGTILSINSIQIKIPRIVFFIMNYTSHLNKC